MTSWVVGSAGDCDVVIDDAVVSGHHCRLTATASGFLLEDLGSTNGTYVNGQRIESVVPVTPSMTVTLGRLVLLPWRPDFLDAQAVIDASARQATKPTAIPGATITIGAEGSNDVVLDFPMVSGFHAHIVKTPTGTLLEDLNSTNGTAIGSPQNKIRTAKLRPEDTVYFGSLHVPASRLLAGNVRLGAEAETTIRFNREQLLLGRDPDCDQVLDYPMISRSHAILKRTTDGNIRVEDLGSANGTFVNGKRVTGPVEVKPEDTIGLGSFSFRLSKDGQLRKRRLPG